MPIIYNESTKTFTLNTPNTTYSFCVSDSNYLRHLYYGENIPDVNLTCDSLKPYSHDTFEYPTSGGADFGEPCLQVMDKYGMSACDLQYKSHIIYKGKEKLKGLPATYANGENETTSLEVVCEDKHSGLEITLQYCVFENQDIITRSCKALNNGSDPIEIKRLLSACVELFGKDYDMLTLNGSWSREKHMERLPLRYGKQSVGSCRGTTSSVHGNFIALAKNDATEEFGEVYGYCLVYSGSFLALCEADTNDKTRMVIGINPYDFSWLLEKGEEFQSPEVIMSFSARGLTGLSHNFHDVIRNNLIRGKWKNARRPVLINNWEGTYFDFDTEKLLDIARESAKAGIEMFVMDDGWFGKRNDDTTSLGDWDVNTEKLKGGLPYLVNEVNKLGMKFGIWFEPEMISPESGLYRANPDWCIHIKGRNRTQMRSQLVLDFSREDVREHIYGKIKEILSSANIEYVKWDMNRSLCEVGNEVLPPNRQREIWHRYVLGVYEMQERLITDFPELLLENCSSGGARFDAGMLYYSPQIWTSDDTDAIERLKIQNGTSLCFPCSCMGAHVSASPNHCVGRQTPFKTRGHVAMVGTFGYELDTTKLSDNEKNAIKEQIEEFNKYNPLIRNGDFYRLADPFKQSKYDAWMFVSKDKSEALLEYVQVLKEPAVPPRLLRFRGLDKNAVYIHEETGKRYSGAFLMNAGFIIPEMWGDFQSYIAGFTKE